MNVRLAPFASLLGSLLAFGCSAAATTEVSSLEQNATDGAPTTDETPDETADAGADATADTTFVDARDGRRYRTLAVGDHVWLAQNLAFASEQGSYCYDDDAASCEEHGRLYTFAAAQIACPAGWHLATDADWSDLERSLGMDEDQIALEGYATPRGTDEGTTLKAKDGFAATMAGFRAGTAYDALGDRTYFWTASTRGADVWRRRITAAGSTVFRFTNPPAGFAISVRCVADAR